MHALEMFNGSALCTGYEDYSPVTEASIEYRYNRGYFRITIIDKNGKHACTNAYFPEDL